MNGAYHPDDPAGPYYDKEQAAFDECYEDAEEAIYDAIMDHQRAVYAAIRTAAKLECAGISTEYGDILTDEYLAVLMMDARRIAREVAQTVAENGDTAFVDDLEEAANAAQAEAAKIMGAKK